METTLRSVNSSSKLQQRKLCPGSALAELGVEEGSNVFAEEGTLLHFHDAHPEESRDSLTPDQREILERNKSLRDRFLSVQLTRLGIPAEARRETLVEQEFLLCDADGIPVTSHGQSVPGHPDLIYYYPDYRIAIIFDSKFGRIVVPPAWVNMQLRSYVVMFLENYDCDTVLVAITQPWAPAPNDFHSAEYSAGDIPAFKQELLNIVRETEDENAPRHPSLEACNYCSALDRCPIAIHTASEIAVTKIKDLTPEQLEDMADDIFLARKVCDTWESRMQIIARTMPTLLKKFELSADSSTRAIIDTPKAFTALHAAGLLVNFKPTPESNEFVHAMLSEPDELFVALYAFLKLSKVSVRGLEDFVREAEGLKKDAAQSRIYSALTGLLVFDPKAASLVRKRTDIHKEAQ